jgi:hypothetical protein
VIPPLEEPQAAPPLPPEELLELLLDDELVPPLVELLYEQ